MKGRKHGYFILGNVAIKHFTGIFQVPGVKGSFFLIFELNDLFFLIFSISIENKVLRRFLKIILDQSKVG